MGKENDDVIYNFSELGLLQELPGRDVVNMLGNFGRKLCIFISS